MLKEAIAEASKYETARRREVKRHREAVDRERANHICRLQELRQALSPAAARIVVAAETEATPVATVAVTAAQMQELMAERQHHGPLKDCVGEMRDQKLTADPTDPNPAPAWLNGEPPPLAPGSLIEVADKPRRAAR